MNKCYGYVRISTEMQLDAGVSVDAQREAIQAYCKFRGMEPEILVETISGTVPLEEREIGRQLLKLKHGDTIVSHKLDRLFRSNGDLIKNVEAWNEKKVKLHVLNICGGVLDTSSPHGKFLIQILGAASELERNMISERTKSAHAYMRTQNKRISRFPPYGWRNEGTTMIPIPEQQELITVMKMMLDNGQNYNEIAMDLNRSGRLTAQGKNWHRGTVQRICER